MLRATPPSLWCGLAADSGRIRYTCKRRDCTAVHCFCSTNCWRELPREPSLHCPAGSIYVAEQTIDTAMLCFAMQSQVQVQTSARQDCGDSWKRESTSDRSTHRTGKHSVFKQSASRLAGVPPAVTRRWPVRSACSRGTPACAHSITRRLQPSHAGTLSAPFSRSGVAADKRHAACNPAPRK